MPRVKIDTLERYPFTTELEVRVTDLNYGGHLAYDRLLGLAHQARLRLLAELDATETDLGDGRTGLVAADAGAVYRSEAFVGDVLVFEIAPVEIGRVTFRLNHRVRRPDDDREVALVEIGFSAFDYERRCPAPLPGRFAEKLKALAS
jgi:acyl-CoA thioester hydrolase